MHHRKRATFDPLLRKARQCSLDLFIKEGPASKHTHSAIPSWAMGDKRTLLWFANPQHGPKFVPSFQAPPSKMPPPRMAATPSSGSAPAALEHPMSQLLGPHPMPPSSAQPALSLAPGAQLSRNNFAPKPQFPEVAQGIARSDPIGTPREGLPPLLRAGRTDALSSILNPTLVGNRTHLLCPSHLALFRPPLPPFLGTLRLPNPHADVLAGSFFSVCFPVHTPSGPHLTPWVSESRNDLRAPLCCAAFAVLILSSPLLFHPRRTAWLLLERWRGNHFCAALA